MLQRADCGLRLGGMFVGGRSMSKTCRKCLKEFPLSEDFFFHKKSSPDGFCDWCKSCKKEYMVQYRETHKSKIKKSRNKYNQDHQVELIRKRKEYYSLNKELNNFKCREYYCKNKDKVQIRYKSYRGQLPLG